jgi:hypothetical protein
MKDLLELLPFASVLACAPLAWTADVRVHPVPSGEPLSKDFRVTVEGQEVPAYVAKVAPADPTRRWKAMDDKVHSADYFETASFAYCDVIHDLGREWTLRVYHCDSARVSNVHFEKLRIEEASRLLSLWIGKTVWTRDDERGQIDGVTFNNIRAVAEPLRVELKGFDPAHAVDQVVFEDVVVNDRPLAAEDVKTNGFVRNVTIRP